MSDLTEQTAQMITTREVNYLYIKHNYFNLLLKPRYSITKIITMLVICFLITLITSNLVSAGDNNSAKKKNQSKDNNSGPILIPLLSTNGPAANEFYDGNTLNITDKSVEVVIHVDLTGYSNTPEHKQLEKNLNSKITTTTYKVIFPCDRPLILYAYTDYMYKNKVIKHIKTNEFADYSERKEEYEKITGDLCKIKSGKDYLNSMGL